MTAQSTIEEIVADRADWLVDAVAAATQNRAFLRGDPAEDKVATEAIYLNGKKAIADACAKARAKGYAAGLVMRRSGS
jgi:hypothetical protein